MTTRNDTRHTWPAPIDELLARVPLFDGFPYLSTRLVPAAYHITLLPDDWTREQLTDALWRQVAANQLSAALVVAEHLAIYLPPSGRLCEGPAPRSDFILTGGLLTPYPLTASQIGDRGYRLEALAAQTRARGGTLFGDLGKGGHEATAEERARLGGRRPREGRKGLSRCATCGDWRGQCLDRIPDYPRSWAVQVHCQCDNLTCCARCGQPFRERRVGGNHFDERDGAIWHWPGFMALSHGCALAVDTDRLPEIEAPPLDAAPASDRTLVYGEFFESLIFAERGRAEGIAAFKTATTWGELRRRAPAMYAEVLDTLDDASCIRDDTPLERDEVPGYCDGDLFFLQGEMLSLIPRDVQQRFGTVGETRFNGDTLVIDAADEEAVVEALEHAGYTCVRDQAWVDIVFA